MTEQATPYTGNVLDIAFARAQAAVVLITGEDIACLGRQYLEPHDHAYEKDLTPQPRPNVIFELGMASGKYPQNTVVKVSFSSKPHAPSQTSSDETL